MEYYDPNATQLDRDLIRVRNHLAGAFAVILLVTAVGVVGYLAIDPEAGFVRAFFRGAHLTRPLLR